MGEINRQRKEQMTLREIENKLNRDFTDVVLISKELERNFYTTDQLKKSVDFVEHIHTISPKATVLVIDKLKPDCIIATADYSDKRK